MRWLATLGGAGSRWPRPMGAFDPRRGGPIWASAFANQRGRRHLSKGVPGMKTSRLARRVGLDGNPLRRRTDKLAACAAALLLAAFLAGAPLLSAAAVGWANRPAAAGPQSEHSWQQVPAILLRAAPSPGAIHGLIGHPRVLARWTAPDGQARTGRIPVSAGLAAGSTVLLWVNAAGWPVGPRLSRGAVLAREATAATVATSVLAAMLLCLARAGRWMLDRRRLAAWDTGWASVGPQWTKRFRSRGLAVYAGTAMHSGTH